MALHISRMVDVAPETELKVKLLNTQRELTKSLVSLEILCNSRVLDESKEGDNEESKDKNMEAETEKTNETTEP